MYFDNLTISGILIVALYALLPLAFGREILHIADDQLESPSAAAGKGETSARLTKGVDCGELEPCR